MSKSKSFDNLISGWLNDLSIKRKLLLVYVVCMFIPLIVTDGIILGMLHRNEAREEQYRMEQAADAVKYLVNSTFDEAVTVINKLYLNEHVYAFLDDDFESELDFFEKRFAVKNNILAPLDGGRESSLNTIILCSDNDGIVNGGNIYQIKDVESVKWDDLLAAKNNMVVNFYYTGDKNPQEIDKKKVYLIRALDHYSWYKRHMMVFVDIDYSELQRKMKALPYDGVVYLCEDDRILLSNTAQKSLQVDYDKLGDDVQPGLVVPWNIYGKSFNILVGRNKSTVSEVIASNLGVIIALILFNLVLPVLMISLINRSFASRLYGLSRAFDEADIDNIRGININEAGKDEIGLLMRGYNRMVDRLNGLIRTNYTGKLERQEIELAKRNAELSALHSQINPHFLFNILESIRMRSVLKGESETAGMIEKMATLVRQNISWSTDTSTISEELEFIRSYLELQQYRFGERLKFEIELDDGCGSYLIPRLTLTTFVENACVHGMEGKTSSCWVYVRVYKDKPTDEEKENGIEERLILEIEDTGSGMSDEDVEYLNDRMNNCTIDDIKDGSHVGMLNACLRLRMSASTDVHFEIESERSVGTYITITIPVRRTDTDA